MHASSVWERSGTYNAMEDRDAHIVQANESRNPALSRLSRRGRMITWTGLWQRGMRRPLMTVSSTSSCSRSSWRAAPSAAALALWQLLQQ